MAEHVSLPVFASVRAAWFFFTANWRRFIAPAFLLALGFFLATRGAAAGNASAASLGVVIWAAMSILYPAAIYRFALRGEYGGLYGMRFSQDEARLAALSLLFTLFLLLAGVAAIAPLLVLVAGVVLASGDPAAMEAAAGDSAATIAAMGPAAVFVFNLGLFVVLAFLIFIAARLALSAPAVVAEQRFVFLKSWPWTKGVFFRLVAVLLLSALPGVLLDALLGGIGDAITGAGAPVPGMALTFAGSFGNALMGVMMSTGAVAYLYRGLRPAEPAAA